MYLNENELTKLLTKKDLTQDNTHAIGILLSKIAETLSLHYNTNAKIERGNPLVSLEDNYYALNYDKNEITLSSRYTKYLNENTILRTQMSSVIPSLLRQYKANIELDSTNQLWLCPGLVYRRDVRDRTHVGEPHQLDIWYLTQQVKTREDLLDLVSTIIGLIENLINSNSKDKSKNSKKAKIKWRYNETSHNYTDNGIEVEIYHNGVWLEILECGLISQNLLKNHGLEGYSGLALGLGLERLVMILKAISDIRTLYSEDSRIKDQMKNLNLYKEVSLQPSIKRDLSIAVDNDLLIEELIEDLLSQVDESLHEKIESISLVNETYYKDLPQVAIDRLGLLDNQKNMLIRIVLRDLSKSLTSEEANEIYTIIYDKVHKGSNGYKITNEKKE